MDQYLYNITPVTHPHIPLVDFNTGVVILTLFTAAYVLIVCITIYYYYKYKANKDREDDIKELMVREYG